MDREDQWCDIARLAALATAFSEAVIHFVYVVVDADHLVLHAIDGDGAEFDSMIVPRTR